MEKLEKKININQGLDEKLIQSNLPSRIIYNLLWNDGIEYLGELVKLQREELLKGRRGLGKIFVEKIEKYVEEKGYSLGMNIEYQRPSIKKMRELSDEIKEDLHKEIDSSQLSVRTSNYLKNLGISYFGELVSKDLGYSGQEMLKDRNLRERAWQEIKNYAEKKGYKLNMDIEYNKSSPESKLKFKKIF